jgi:hypothetical protein
MEHRAVHLKPNRVSSPPNQCFRLSSCPESSMRAETKCIVWNPIPALSSGCHTRLLESNQLYRIAQPGCMQLELACGAEGFSGDVGAIRGIGLAGGAGRVPFTSACMLMPQRSASGRISALQARTLVGESRRPIASTASFVTHSPNDISTCSQSRWAWALRTGMATRRAKAGRKMRIIAVLLRESLAWRKT